jgi:hypothetical protein
LELALSQEVYEYLEELDEMNWSARGNVLNQYLRNTSIGTTVIGSGRLLDPTELCAQKIDHLLVPKLTFNFLTFVACPAILNKPYNKKYKRLANQVKQQLWYIVV